MVFIFPANEMPTVRLPSVIGTESNGLQAIALPDGSVAYLSQAEPGKEKGKISRFLLNKKNNIINNIKF